MSNPKVHDVVDRAVRGRGLVRVLGRRQGREGNRVRGYGQGNEGCRV